MRATDADDPTTANGELRYSLTPSGDLSAFEIDSISGRLAAPTSHMMFTCSNIVFFFLNKLMKVDVSMHKLFLLQHDSKLTSDTLSLCPCLSPSLCRYDQLQDKHSGPGNQGSVHSGG